MALISSSRTAAKICAVTGQMSLAFMVLMVLIAGWFTPGYSHVSQFISELGAREAPCERSVRLAGFLPMGVLFLSFCLSAFYSLPRSRATVLGLAGLAIFAAGYLVAAAFPCDPGCRPSEPSTSQLIHNAGGIVGYLLAPGFLFCLARAARSWPDAGFLARAGYAASVLALVGLLTISPTSPMAGLSQRLLEASVLVWVALCGRYVSKADWNRPGPV